MLLSCTVGTESDNDWLSMSACYLLSLPPGGPGLHDPCEKEPTNTLASMTDQQAEDITFSAQVHTYNVV